MKALEQILTKLEMCLSTGTYEALETDLFELKPCPATGVEWRQISKSVNAFLNTRGGIVIIGIKEEQTGSGKKLVFTGYREDAEPKIQQLAQTFTDINCQRLDLSKYFPNPQVREFYSGRIAVVYVDELPADEKFCFYENESFKRLLTGDVRHTPQEISAQEEYKLEASLHRELLTIEGTSINDIDLDKLNEYIQLLNQQAKIATLKPDLASARPFLEGHQMLKEDKVTLLGMLICGKEPAARLNFRCRVQGYLDAPDAVAGDKMALDGNVIQLMEAANTFIVRNTRKAVVADSGGRSIPEFPAELLRESVNNAFAHRDYSIDHYVSILIRPDEHIEIRNPGSFRTHLLVQVPDDTVPIYRVIPEAKARNPKLAHMLHLYDKWEGRGRGMATLVSLCLQDKIDVPIFRFRSQEVSLFIRPGPLVDQRIRSLFNAHEGYLRHHLQGNQLTAGQQRVIAYLIKSQEANGRIDFTILLTQDNDYFDEIRGLEKAGLISRHPKSPDLRPVYIVDPILTSTDYTQKLRETFGEAFDTLDQTSKEILSAIYRFQHYSLLPYPGARLLAITLWDEHGEDRGDIRRFDAFDRNVRLRMRRLEKEGFVARQGGSPRRPGYGVNFERAAPLGLPLTFDRR